MPPDNASEMTARGPERATVVPRLGATMRRLRVTKRLTLQQLAMISGVSVGMLSQIERDRANPSLRVLCQVRDALGASMADLFAETPVSQADPDFVCRADSRPQLELGYVRKELLSRTKPGGLQLMILILPPHSASGTLTTPHEKGGMVLEGALVLTVAGEDATLHEGDSFLFDGTEPHTFRNPQPTPAHILWVMAAPRQERHL